MWTKPWKLREGFVIGLSLAGVGLVLQASVGPIDWNWLAHPINIITLVVFCLLSVIVYFFRQQVYLFRYLSTYSAAIPSLCCTIAVTLIMGCIPQTQNESRLWGIDRMLCFWPFVLTYIMLTLILAQVVIKRLVRFHLSDIPFMLNHAGLLIAMVCATLGSADMQRVRMTILDAYPEWRAVDEDNGIHDLPFSIRLKKFTIEEYPPQLVVTDNETGRPMTDEFIVIDSNSSVGHLNNLDFMVDQYLEYASPRLTETDVDYHSWKLSGAVTAVRVKTSLDGIEGWVSSGSYLFPAQTLKLNGEVSLTMLPREPKSYVSEVEITTRSGKDTLATIEVNKPVTVDGWKIYQLDYDQSKGRWSEVSVLELVRDPWLIFVYIGIGMMVVGALTMMMTNNRINRHLQPLKREAP